MECKHTGWFTGVLLMRFWDHALSGWKLITKMRTDLIQQPTISNTPPVLAMPYMHSPKAVIPQANITDGQSCPRMMYSSCACCTGQDGSHIQLFHKLCP